MSYIKRKRLIGSWGEQLVAGELVHAGYEIVEMNFHTAPYGEIYIIARNDDITVFVEVKTATQTKFGELEEQVDEVKLEK